MSTASTPLTLRISRTAAPGEPSRRRRRHRPSARRGDRGRSQTKTIVPIAVAKAAATPADHTVRFQVIRPDGRPVTDQDVSFQFGQRGETHWNRSMSVDSRGIGAIRSLRQVSLTSQCSFATSPRIRSRSGSLITRPSAGAGLVGCTDHRADPPGRSASPFRVDSRPPARARRSTGSRHRSQLPSPFDRNGPFVSTDTNGEVLLEGLSVGKYQVQGHIEAAGPLPCLSAGRSPTTQR